MSSVDARPSRPTRTAALLLLALLAVWAMGPWLLLVAFLVVLRPVRRGLRSIVSWRAAVGVTAVVTALVVVVLVLPDGRLPIPSGPGLLVAPTYAGGAVRPRPVSGTPVPQNPYLAGNGTSSMHDDAWATDAYAGPGPIGRQVQVRSAWYGLEECASLAFDSRGRLIGLCGDLKGPQLHVIDPVSLRKLSSVRLPDRPPSDKPAWQNLCGGAYFYLDNAGRAVVATTDRRVLVFDATGGRLHREQSFGLTEVIPRGDCLVALLPDWSGRIWFVTQRGVVGALDPRTGRAQALALGPEKIANSIAADAAGGVYVVSDHAFYRFSAGTDGRPRVDWRSAYDRGNRTKPGQLSQGSGTTPTVLPGGRVAITDNAEPRMHVQVYDARTGHRTCSLPVFAAGRSATENSMASIGDALFVENNYGYHGPQSVLLGHATEPGISRIDVATCRVRWTSKVVAPTSVPKASLATGLLYVYSKRPSRWGVDAWYFTALDLRTGHLAFSRRTGLGPLYNNHYSAVTLAPDGSAYVATMGGMLRVRDRASPRLHP